jgi:hypothetical protein
MTFSRAALGLLLCGCAHTTTTPKVTVATVLPRAQEPVAVPEPEEDFGCGVFAKNGASEDPKVFRACVERLVSAEPPCEDGGSPDLAMLELAVVLVDGSGGTTDIPRARKLLAACYRDVAVDTVLTHADDKESDPRTPPMETCDDFAQTTLSSTACLVEHVQNEKAWLRVVRRSLGPVVRPVFDAASVAAEAWERKLGEIDYARFGGGTMRGTAMESRIFTAMKTRHLRLDRIHERTGGEPPSGEDRASARDELSRAKRAITDDAEPEVVSALEAEENAWIAYRDAEASLYDTLYPGARAAVTIELAWEHARTLCAMSDEP